MMVVILPVLTMAIGFLMGLVVMDSIGDDKRISKIEREIKRLERKMEVTR